VKRCLYCSSKMTLRRKVYHKITDDMVYREDMCADCHGSVTYWSDGKVVHNCNDSCSTTRLPDGMLLTGEKEHHG